VARTTGRRTTRCPLGVNGGEYPHWSVAKICDLAVKLGAEFVELSTRRVIVGGPQAVLKETRRRRLGIHIGAMVSELTDAFVAAHAVGAPLIVAVDDAIERAELSRGQSIRVFRQLVVGLLDQPVHRSIRLALENSVIRITRLPADLLALLEAVDHPRFGINFDADNFYNAGTEPFRTPTRSCASTSSRCTRRIPGGTSRRSTATTTAFSTGPAATSCASRWAPAPSTGPGSSPAFSRTATEARCRSSRTCCPKRWRPPWRPTPHS